MREVLLGELNARQILSFELKRELLENFPGRIPDVRFEMEDRLLEGRVEIDAVLSLLKKVPGPFSASFLFFTRNNRQIMPPDYSGVKNLFCYVQRRAIVIMEMCTPANFRDSIPVITELPLRRPALQPLGAAEALAEGLLEWATVDRRRSGEERPQNREGGGKLAELG